MIFAAYVSNHLVLLQSPISPLLEKKGSGFRPFLVNILSRATLHEHFSCFVFQRSETENVISEHSCRENVQQKLQNTRLSLSEVSSNIK